MKSLRLFLASVGFRTRMYPLVAPPLGIMALAAYVREKCANVDIQLVHQRLENTPDEELVRRAAAFQPDIVGFSCLTTSAYLLGDLTRQMRQALPKALFILGGPHASGAGADAMAACDVDVVVIGEGELTLAAIVEAMRDGKDFGHIPGLVWRNADGAVVTNPGQTPFVPDLDTLPIPAYDLIDMPKYWRHQSVAPVVRRRYVSLVTSRGCPYRCMWCHNIFGKNLRRHSPERIVKEVRHFKDTYGVNDFEFLDDNFNFDAPRVVEFADLLHKENLRIKIAFPNGIRGDLITQEVCEAMVSAGAYQVSFALESGSPRIQQFTCKHLNIPKFLRGVEMMEARHVYVNGFCMLGFPTETEAELQETIDVACQSRFHTASFYTVTPFPGTPLYDYVKETRPEKLGKIRYDDMDFSSMRVNLTDLPDEVLYAYQRKAMRRFFMNPNRFLRLLRNYPQPHLLPLYIPIFIHRATKGLFGNA